MACGGQRVVGDGHYHGNSGARASEMDPDDIRLSAFYDDSVLAHIDLFA